MAIFNKSDQQTNHQSNITTIATGTDFTGKAKVECSLHINGVVNGEIDSTNVVTIGKSGVVKCDLKAQKLIVSGQFFGNADCESIELLSTGKIEGQLTAASLTIDSGGSFQGQSIRKSPGDTQKVVDFASETRPIKNNP